MKSSSYLPFLLTLTTANAAALLPRSPQGPDSSPGPYVANPAPSVLTNPAVPLNPAATSTYSLPPPSLRPYVANPASPLLSNPAVPLNAAATSTYSLPAAAASSAAAELNVMMDEIMNSTYLNNETYPYYNNYYNGSYHHHHHYHNSSYWNSTNFLNISEYYNTTDNVVEVVALEANGTTTTQFFNVSGGYGYGYGYGNYTGSGWGHHNHTGQYNGTRWWTELMDNATDTDTAAMPLGTGTAAVPLSTGTGMAPTYDLATMPGFTGPKKGKRGSKLFGRWLSGVM